MYKNWHTKLSIDSFPTLHLHLYDVHTWIKSRTKKKYSRSIKYYFSMGEEKNFHMAKFFLAFVRLKYTNTKVMKWPPATPSCLKNYELKGPANWPEKAHQILWSGSTLQRLNMLVICQKVIGTRMGRKQQNMLEEGCYGDEREESDGVCPYTLETIITWFTVMRLQKWSRKLYPHDVSTLHPIGQDRLFP